MDLERIPPMLLALALAHGAARADVLVVDVLGSGEFTQINQAMAAAQDGDTILVRTGNYAPFVNPGRDVDVVAEEGAWVHVNGYIGVFGLEEGEDVVLSGLRSIGTLPTHFGLLLAQNAGSVRVQDCHFTGYAGAQTSCDHGEPGTDAIRIEDCADVALVGVTAIGGRGGDQGFSWEVCPLHGTAGGHGLSIQQSRVAVHDSELTGGGGGWSGYGGSGGAGGAVHSGELFASGTVFTGGRGGNGNDVIIVCAQSGAGLWVSSGATARILDCELHGGPPGEVGVGTCSAGPPSIGRFDTLDGDARRFLASRTVQAGAPANLELQGQPGEAVWLFVSRQPEQSLDLALAGTWLIRTPALTTVAPLGILDAEGRLEVAWPAGSPGAGVLAWHLQALFVGDGGPRLAGARQVHVFAGGL